MINGIWLGFIVIGVIVSIFTGNVQAVTDAAISFADTAVEIAIGLIGIMTLWLGIMAIAEKAGLIRGLAKALSPIMKRLFPDVPEDHPAMGAMIMNIAANILGLGNAATPFGLKAMEELNTLNEHKGVATDAMAMFLAINTSSVTLLPATVIGLRAAAGSTNATEVIGPIILATTISTVSAIILAKLFSKMKRYQIEKIIDETDVDVKEG
ncbi:nucleoside recognition domain-containing protein [Sedimentibacter sp. MB31-C6]|uniref:nucleoside recognition domain-containing protein n=1 Tax=Sedimentibacter sp. MB31-C6 TaxID=3109366 RepID=UPI002DDDAC33|nr:nucleoside recognition domain-containing protein [Sedimentibacter sp. MB36-C1]WSI02898.1 nucleoside recognition domain-containing protein [Sedimentibacter sp. MB36-C1]